MTQDRPLIGISLMLGFCILTPVGDAAAKLLGELMPLVVLVFFRFSIQALILVPIVALTARPWRMPARLTKLMVARTLLHIVGISAMFGALKSIREAFGPLILDAIGHCGKWGQSVPSSGGSHYFLVLDPHPTVRLGGR